uniref:OCIA domain containing 2 n=1 Tax=Pelusios castaneus TaxID=367368 RepID=A0A8C8SL60_9SAUR
MSSETAQSKVQASSEQQNQKSVFHCPLTNAHNSKEEVERIYRECRSESFWYRGLPVSVGSMLITYWLIYKDFLPSNPRFGSLPKIARRVIRPARNAKQNLDLMERKTQNLKLHNPRLSLFKKFHLSFCICRIDKDDKFLQKKSP